LAAYAVHHNMPVRNSVRASRLTKSGDLFVIATTSGDITATNVIIATGSYCDPKVPHIPPNIDNWFARTFVVRAVRRSAERADGRVSVR
jgi:putative flavoprotein involved in K+ transport